MPELNIKHQKKKTIIENLDSVANSLHRHPATLLSYWSQTLGCGKIKQGLCGCHSRETLQESLQGFVQLYVLCDQCDLPETDLYGYRNSLEKVCSACGANSFMDKSDHKLVAALLKQL